MQFRRLPIASVMSVVALIWGIVLISATYIFIALLPILIIAFCVYKFMNIFSKNNSENCTNSVNVKHNDADVIDVEYKIIDK